MAVREVIGRSPHPEASSIIPVPVPEFGNTSYLVVSGDEALAIDPPRDISRLRTLAHRRGARIRLVVETHVHNDYLSGALAMRRATGAEIAVPARGGYRFEHRSLDDGDELRIGDLRLLAIATPGHTPEHLAYLVHRDDHGAPEAVFSGGSLLVGTAGRNDLLGPDHADELDRAQYRSIHRLASLPADITLFPTHGAGSSCSVDPAIDRRARSTIGEERTDNPALTAPDVEAFLSGRRSIHLPIRATSPRWPSGTATACRRSTTSSPALGPEEVARILTGGGWVIDAREPYAFAAASIPGSVWIPPDSLFATHVASVVPADVRFALVLDHPELEQLQQVLAPLGSIGYTPVEGFLSGGIGAGEPREDRYVSCRPARPRHSRNAVWTVTRW